MRTRRIISVCAASFLFVPSVRAVVVDIPNDVPGGAPAESIPWSAAGTTSGTAVSYTLSAGGLGLDRAGHSNYGGAFIIYEGQTAGSTSYGYMEMTFAEAVMGLTFGLRGFGNLRYNYDAALHDVSKGIQTFSLVAYSGGNALDLDSANAPHTGALVSLTDNGVELRGTAGVWNSMGGTTIGDNWLDRGVDFSIPGPVTKVRFEFSSQALVAGDGLVGDAIELGNFAFAGTVPEPSATLLAVLGLTLLGARRLSSPRDGVPC